MSSKKSLELNSSSIEWFVRKLSCFACEAFSFFSFSFSKEIKSSSSSNLFIINSMLSSLFSFSFIHFSRRDFFFLFFFFYLISHVSLIFFYSTSKSWMSCNNSTNIKKTIFCHFFDLFNSSFFCLANDYVFCMHVILFHSSEFHELSINSLFLIIFFFLQFCDDDLLRILFNEF
jgi:hypothetical protein